MRRCLHRLGYAWKRPRYVLAPDPQREKKSRLSLSGWNAHRMAFGGMHLATGHRLFQVRHQQRAEDFQAFLRRVRRQYRGWQVTLLLDGNKGHTADASPALAQRLGLRLLWLP